MTGDRLTDRRSMDLLQRLIANGVSVNGDQANAVLDPGGLAGLYAPQQPPRQAAPPADPFAGQTPQDIGRVFRRPPMPQQLPDIGALGQPQQLPPLPDDLLRRFGGAGAPPVPQQMPQPSPIPPAAPPAWLRSIFDA